ncbi:MAG: glycine cleavage system protein GcvH [Alphaproteobacteria bacterium]|jgi:glycine cleavage system H protein|nr:glycine cleavage system protein GcvH [Alphaproteobacteria bacterium]MBP9876830.1 glycine cleavage system protein GcvH [Alphaproteobacteria bacterium]
MKKFSKDHEWIMVEDNQIAKIGITDYAQKQLGDIVFVDLPALGKIVSKGSEAAVVESVKAASEVYAPIDGEIILVNDKLTGDPALVNNKAESDGWFFKLKMTDASQLNELMDEQAYKAYLKDLA